MPTKNLILHQFELGPMDNFQYFLGDQTTKEIAVVDPAWDPNFLVAEAKKRGYTIKAIFLTHGHPDHVNGLDGILSAHKVPVFLSQHEASFYTPKCATLQKVAPGQKLKIGQVEFETLLTPGHTPGCQCFLAEGQLVTGDTLFVDGCGRCDLPGSDPKVMYNSLYNVLMKLPEETVIYPGHNYGPTPTDTIGHQKKSNPYLQCHSLKEFLEERMGMTF